MAHCPAENPPKHVAPAFVAGIDSVGQEEAHRPGVVRQHPVGATVLGAPVVRAADQLAHPIDQGQEDVGVEVVVLALHDRGDALETRTRYPPTA